MNRELRQKAVESAAARYGAEHYRGILFWVSFGKWWPVGVVAALILGIYWLTRNVSPGGAAAGGFGVAAVALALLVIWLIIRRLRSPYRRRRF
jgi:hypothetical protein